MKLDGKVAIVTGSGRGLGKAIAARLALEGAQVVVCARGKEAIQQVADEICSAGGNALALHIDVTSRGDWQRLVESVVQRFGTVHILVNNAGIDCLAKIAETTEKDLDAVLNVDLKGVFYGIQAVIPHMTEQNYGKILNIVSIAAAGGYAGMGAYGAAKAGVVQLTKVAARELKKNAINVNAIAPGQVMTEMLAATLGKETAQKFIERDREWKGVKNPKPEDIANAALFLVSEDARCITGQTLFVEGGRGDYMV